MALILHHQSLSSSSIDQYGYEYSQYYLGLCFGAFACLIQLGTNLYNDYSDFIKGADTDDRVGQARATQKGWLTPYETAFASTFCLAIATALGLYLTFLASSWRSISPSTSSSTTTIDYYMLFITISSVFNAFCYTGGEYPLGYIGLGNLSIGYSGLGDLFVFLYFGIVATITVPYLYLVQEQQFIQDEERQNVWKSEFMYQTLFTSIPIGCLATAIITVNNLRDRETDVIVGKNTMAVRFGAWFTRLEYTILVIGSYIALIPLSSILSHDYNRWILCCLPLLSFPLARKELKAVGFGGKDGAALNPHVGGVAKVQLVYCILLIAGLKLSRSL